MSCNEWKETEIGLIPMDWEYSDLKDKVEVIMGQSPKSEYYNSICEGIPFLQGRKTFGDKFPSIDTWCSNPIKVAQKGDVLLSVRAPVGDLNVANQDICIGRGLASLRMKNNNNEFLYYLLKHYKANIINKQSGTVFGSINKNDIEYFKLPFPPLNEQKAIAKILSDLDEKVEINNRINKVLEEIAQTIFKRWFVDFEFPNENGELYKSSGGEMVESELGLIPKGWEVITLDEIAIFTNGLAMQKFRPKEGEKSIPVLKIKELRQGFVDESSELCSNNIESKYIVEDGDVIFSWSGSLLVDIWAGGKCGLNQHLFKVTSNKYNKWFYYLWTKYYLDKFILIAKDKATTMGHIKRSDLSNAKVLIPKEKEYIVINKLLEPLIQLLIENKIENRKLTQLRDTLLPKLMSGEIRVDLINGQIIMKNTED